jgi:NinB protein
MSRALITIRGTADRMRACRLIEQAPFGTRVEFKAVKRTIPQNDRLWAMLTDVSRQLVWHGQKLRPDDWKIVFIDALKREKRCVPAIEGDGFVDLGRSSSDLSKSEMSELIELIAAFGSQHGVKFGDDEQAAA